MISVLVMIVGAVMAGANDLEFSAVGYFWMVMNCVFTAGSSSALDRRCFI